MSDNLIYQVDDHGACFTLGGKFLRPQEIPDLYNDLRKRLAEAEASRRKASGILRRASRLSKREMHDAMLTVIQIADLQEPVVGGRGR